MEEDVKTNDVREGEASASASGSSSATPPAVPTTPVPAAAGRAVHQQPTTEPESKRQRISLIESSVRNVIGQLLRQDISEAGQLCKKETFKKIIESLDEAWTRKILKKSVQEARQIPNKAAKKGNITVGEVYSPPRMAKAAEKLGMTAEFSLDLSTVDEQGQPWDFSSASAREKALRLVDDTKPNLLVVSPPCTMFSAIQNLNFEKMTEEHYMERMKDAVMHFAFAVLLCLRQNAAGRYFALEQPVAASSWSLKLTSLLSRMPGVERVNFDFCMLGMLSTDSTGVAPAKKRTSVITNSASLAAELRRHQCDGRHRHVALLGERCRKAQEYPDKFCRIVLEAVRSDIERTDITCEMNALAGALNALEVQQDEAAGLYEDFDFVDDVSNKFLDKHKAIEARRLEIEFFRKMMVYEKVPRHFAHGRKVITTRWLDVNKGDTQRPNYRARLVGRELKLKDKRLDLFAATPPLESLRLLCSICASHQNRPSPYRMLSIDVKRAYFYAEAKREVFIEIPLEDWEPGDEHKVARLNLSLYGTRDAAQNWSEEFTRTLVASGFQTGKATPCNFVHQSREVYVTVHGDDFTAVGPAKDLQWFEGVMKAKYDIKVEYLGPKSEGCVEEIRVLNRTIRWTNDGLEYEPDCRHAEMVIRHLGVENCKPVTTPGCTEAEYDETSRGEYEPLRGAEATEYRTLAARLNYLALDRMDIQFAVKEVAKHMARPVALDWVKLKRLARYLAGKPRYVQRYEWQHFPSHLDAFADSDWAGDKTTRKSTSGGLLTMGGHLIKSWSSSQPTIALSSGEAELYAIVKAASQAAGLVSMLCDFGFNTSATVHTDSTAAIGITHRRGLGKTRHIHVQYLWVQEKVSNKELTVQKVGTNDNPADAMTKNLKAEALNRHVQSMGGWLPETVASTSLIINGLSRADEWNYSEGHFVRAHNKPRETLFTPMKVAGGPLAAAQIHSSRITVGKFVGGQDFVLVDNWKTSAEPHRRLQGAWTGRTIFQNV